MTERIARAIVLSFLRRIEIGRLTVVEDGRRSVFGHGAPEATVCVHAPRAWTALLRGSRGLAESYRDGLWDTPDLTAVIRVAARNVDGLDTVRRRLTPLREPLQRGRAAFRRNTPRRSRKDISAHYDLGNDLFGLMLDPTMMYSSAVFDAPGMTLAEASMAKLERICDKLRLGPEDHVLEIGTGWGGYADHAAPTRACRVTTTTISRDQRDHPVARVRELGLEERVTVLLDDYRDLTGQYDKLVSIEMIEAVGWKDFDTFFGVCSDRLAPDGSMLLQAIVMDDRAYQVERASKSFIRTLIFPNGCLPSREVIARCVARDTDLHAVHLEDLTPHYAETLKRWRGNFDAAESELERLGYDERFRRLWRMYLAYCEAGFAERRIGLIQTVLAKPCWRPAVTVAARAGRPGQAPVATAVVAGASAAISAASAAAVNA
ncbi:MAG: cyclopropane-fatty-acyl-phospholipid synthase [Baekduia sp.]|nr:cyclopropane-fatty-acyl-phospholipid synthase [Baekduia sp.]